MYVGMYVCMSVLVCVYVSMYTLCMYVCIYVRTYVIVVLKRLFANLSSCRHSFNPMAFHVGFVLDKSEVGQALLPVHRLSPIGIIPLELYTLSPIIRATDNGLFRARSSHRYCPFPAKGNKRT